MITIIYGEPGRGKTALMTYFALLEMVEKGFENYWNSCRRIDVLRKGGFTKLQYLPQRHTVYADYVIKLKYPNIESYYVDGFRIALPNPFFDTAFFAPYSKIFLDEAQKYYDSRMSKYMRECVYRFYQLHRHNHLDVTMTCQRLGNIDLNIRQIAERFIYIKGLDVKEDKYGQITKMTWSVIEFSSLKDAEAFVDSPKTDKKIKETTYTYEGNVFNRYNSYGNEPAFYDGNYYRNFDCYVEEEYDYTVESFVLYNENHMYYAPVGFWKDDKRDKELLKERGYTK